MSLQDKLNEQQIGFSQLRKDGIEKYNRKRAEQEVPGLLLEM